MVATSVKKREIVSWGVLGLGCAGLLGLLYLGTLQMGYSWHFGKIPAYFLLKDHRTIAAPFDGNVLSITATPNGSDVVIEGFDGTQSPVHVPSKAILKVELQDAVDEGGMVAQQAFWRLGPLTMGLLGTLVTSLLACLLGLALCIPLALARNAKPFFIRNSALVFIETIRGTPLLVQLFIAYFIIGSFLQLSNLAAGIIALGMFASVYYAEIIRGSLMSLPKGQQEAGFALGLTQRQIFRYILLPQAFQKSIPAMIGQSISLVKDSSLLSVIAISELTKNAREVVSASFASFEVWLLVAALYLILTLSVAALGRFLEKRYQHD